MRKEGRKRAHNIIWEHHLSAWIQLCLNLVLPFTPQLEEPINPFLNNLLWCGFLSLSVKISDGQDLTLRLFYNLIKSYFSPSPLSSLTVLSMSSQLWLVCFHLWLLLLSFRVWGRASSFFCYLTPVCSLKLTLKFSFSVKSWRRLMIFSSSSTCLWHLFKCKHIWPYDIAFINLLYCRSGYQTCKCLSGSGMWWT